MFLDSALTSLDSVMLAQNATPWFTNYGVVGGMLGAGVGILGGGIYGPLVGSLAPLGKARGLVMGYHWTMVALGAALFIAGIVALVTGQPFPVTACIGGPGLLVLLVLLPLTPVLKMRYREAELRRLEAETFRQG